VKNMSQTISKTINNTHKRRQIITFILLTLIVAVPSTFFATYMVYARPTTESASYVVWRKNSTYYAKNGATGAVQYSGTNASAVIQAAMDALTSGESIFLQHNTYVLTSDLVSSNKSHLTIRGDNAVLQGGRIIIYGNTYNQSKRNRITGFIFNGAKSGVRIENSFASKIEDCEFDGCNIGIELINTKTWTELTSIENVYFYGCRRGLVFSTNSANGTDSYMGTKVEHALFSLRAEGDIGIDVEQGANYGDSFFSSLKFWFKANGTIGFRHNGSAERAVLLRASFENFADPYSPVIGIQILSTYAPYLMQPFWYGEWVVKIDNPNSVWLYGVGSLRKETDRTVNIGVDNTYGTETILHSGQGFSTFAPKIRITRGGTFGDEETITVRVRFIFIDGTTSSLILEYVDMGSAWLTDENYLVLYPSCKPLSAISIQAKTDLLSTSATITIDWYAAGA
jgi:hypothetical protein